MKTTSLRPWLNTTLKEVDDLQSGDLMLYCNESLDLQVWLEVASTQRVDTSVACLVVVHFPEGVISGGGARLTITQQTYTAGHLVPVLMQEETTNESVTRD